MAFDSKLVGIERHRRSVTQGEVSVTYAGEQLGRFGDPIKLVQPGDAPAGSALGGFAGASDAYWIEAARKIIDMRELLETLPLPATAPRIAPARAEVTYSDGGPAQTGKVLATKGPDFWADCRIALGRIANASERPDSIGAMKVDVRVTFADGETYDARCELKNTAKKDHGCDLAQHIQDFIACHTGKRPSHCNATMYAEYLRALGVDKVRAFAEFRARYALADSEIPAPAEIVAPATKGFTAQS